jgi:uncharacterized protein (DUF362 family)
MTDTLIKIKANNDLRESIESALEPLGGIGRFLARGEKVLVKPNFNTADPFPGSSDRDFVGAFVDLCHDAGAGEVIVGDSCTYFLKTKRVMEKWGCHELQVGRPWLKLANFDDGQWISRALPQGKFLKSVSVPELLGQVDKVFILPCLKTHKLAQYTGALKLAVGLMKPSERLPLHFRHLQEKIAELNLAYKPNLVVMDARKCFITGGPMSGELREPGLILAGTNRVAMDIEGVKIIQSFEGNALKGVTPKELPQIKRAIEIGIDRS